MWEADRMVALRGKEARRLRGVQEGQEDTERQREEVMRMIAQGQVG